MPNLQGFIAIAKGVVIFETYATHQIVDINEVASMFQSIDTFSQLEGDFQHRPEEISFSEFRVVFQKSAYYDVYYGIIAENATQSQYITKAFVTTIAMFEQQFTVELQQENYSSFFLNFAFIKKLKTVLQQINERQQAQEQQRLGQIDSEIHRPTVTRKD